MKKVNKLYLILLLALIPVLFLVLKTGLKISLWFLWLLPCYVGWFVFLPVLFYVRNKKKRLKEGFICHNTFKAAYATFWLDQSHGELAVISLFNPYQVQYIPVDRIEDASVFVKNLDKNKVADSINLILTVNGKKQKSVVVMSSKYYIIHLDGNGKAAFEETKRFAEQIMEAKRLLEQKEVIVIRNY